MSLREEPNEHNEQRWRAHLEQERHDLSASVEAALMDDRMLTHQWEDEFNEQDASQSETSGTELVPPRLSLQSKMLPAVQPERFLTTTTEQPERFLTTTTDTYQMVSPHGEKEAPSDPSSQPSGMLARLTRRLTLSFSVVKPEMLPQQQTTQPPFTEAANQDREAFYPPFPSNKPPSASINQTDTPLVRVIDTVIPTNPLAEKQQAEPKKRRSLKRNGKVRLETTEQPPIAKVVRPSQPQEQETGEAFLADVRNALNRQQAPPMALARGEKQSNTQDGTSHSITSNSTTQTSFYGSGSFESEQSDITIVNPHITASSVVLVTLTTNPGPVVVQYISLQPQIGFTVHLTAPVTTRATFNYVIVLGEMVLSTSMRL